MDYLPPEKEIQDELKGEFIFPSSPILEIGLVWFTFSCLLEFFLKSANDIITKQFRGEPFSVVPMVGAILTLPFITSIIGIFFSRNFTFKRQTKRTKQFWHDSSSRLLCFKLSLIFVFIYGYYLILKLVDLTSLIKIKSGAEVSVFMIESVKEGIFIASILLIFLGLIQVYFFNKRYLTRFGIDRRSHN